MAHTRLQIFGVEVDVNKSERRGRRLLDTRYSSRRAHAVTDIVQCRLRSTLGGRNRTAKSHARILVVEHDRPTRETLALMLNYYGYEVTLASNGTEARAMLADVTPDLVVMDWRTPGLSGFSLCLALRRRWPMMPIVVVTSSHEVFDGDQPVNAWLQKPIDPPLLNQVIHDELAPVHSS
jgi:CheY-like chemotaxis protein